MKNKIRVNISANIKFQTFATKKQNIAAIRKIKQTIKDMLAEKPWIVWYDDNDDEYMTDIIKYKIGINNEK